MNLNLSDIHFSKHELSIYEDLFTKLDVANKGYISTNILSQLLNNMKLDIGCQNQIFSCMNLFNTDHFERKDLYILLRLASVLYTRNKVSIDLVCKFDTPTSFLDLLIDSARKIVISDQSSKNIVLPPPPTKTKLKRVHTIPGPSSFPAETSHFTSISGSSISAVPTSSLSPPKQQCSSNLSDGLQKYQTKFLSDQDSAKISDDEDDGNFDFWRINAEQQSYYIKQFSTLQSDMQGSIRGNVAKVFFEKSGLPVTELSCIWKLSDIDKNGALSLPEFCIAMHLVVLRRNNVEIPNTIPVSLLEIYNNLNAQGFDFQISTQNLFNTAKLKYNEIDDVTDQIKNYSLDLDVGSSTSKKWTQFNDSPVPQAGTSLGTSPTQLVNFDYNVDYIVKNPQIKHPVPVRLSPTSPPLVFDSKPKDLDNPLSQTVNSFRCTNSNENSFTSYHLANIEKSNSSDNWNFNQTDTNSNLLSPSNKSWSNGFYTESQNNSQNITDYLSRIEDRIVNGYKTPNEVKIPENFANIDELHECIRALKEYGSIVGKKNQEMYCEIISLINLVRHLNSSSQKCATCTTQSNTGKLSH